MANQKIIVKESDLPPLTTKNIGVSQYLQVINAQFISNYKGKSVFWITTSEPHNFIKGNVVVISRNKSEDEVYLTVITDIEGAKEIIEVPSANLNQFYVEAPADTLPELIPTDLHVAKIPQQYYVRYRIISDDFNKVSHWSPIYALSGLQQEVENLGNLSIEYNIFSDLVISTWDMPSNATSTQNFDVYVAWGSSPTSVGNFYYYNTVAGNSVTIPLGAPLDENGVGARGNIELSNIQSVSISVQLSTLPRKRRIPSLTIAKSQNPYPINGASSS